MKLAFSNIAWDPENDGAVLKYLSQKGFTGLEIAPTKLFGADPYARTAQAGEYCRRLAGEYGMRVCSMQSLWYGQTGNIFSSAADRERLKEYTLRAIDFAAAIGCKNLVFGNPRARSRNGSREDAPVAEFFSDIARYAYEKGTCMALEPNPTIYGTDFINTTAEAFAYCDSLENSHLKVNVDLGTVICNGEELQPIRENLDRVNHIHISEPHLLPIERRALHRRLSDLTFDGYISVEMGKPEALGTVFSVIDYIAEVFGNGG